MKRLVRAAGVTVTGRVQDVRPYLAHARLAVAPLRIARGVQNKILEAMAMAKVVVASSEAAAAIEAAPGKELLVAPDAASFAAMVLRHLAADDRQAIGAAARERVLAVYSWPQVVQQIQTILEAA